MSAAGKQGLRLFRWTVMVAAVACLSAATSCVLPPGTFPAAPANYPPALPDGYVYAYPSHSQQMWALATDAVLTEANGDRHDVLGGVDPATVSTQENCDLLARWWGIYNRGDLLETLAWIDQGGHRREFDEIAGMVAGATPQQLAEMRAQAAGDPQMSNSLEVVIRYHDQVGQKSITAWDYSRYVSLCGWGYAAGYITEAEAWERIMPAAIRMQETFDSWEDLGLNYLIGREFWSLSATESKGEAMRRAYDRLLTDSDSPWVQLEWNTRLTTP